MIGRSKVFLAGLLCLSITAISMTTTSLAQSAEIATSNISGDVDNPRRHARIKNTRKLTRVEAKRIYNLIAIALDTGYVASNLSGIKGYQELRKFNSAPYLSASHGNHLLNNYGNDAAISYGKFEESGSLPVGAVLFKDSFSVEENRQIILGPLFIMEKMPKGFNSVSGDWKYIQIQPTGEILGETNGENSSRVDYCIDCHITRSATDHLFYIPVDYRISH